MTQDFECASCCGYGTDGRESDGNCFTCNGDGWISCDRGGVDCPHNVCACERAWERQQEDNANEPPISMDERHQMAADEKRRLRS